MIEMGLVYGLITVLFWGIADALASVPAKRMSPIAITLAIDLFIFVFFGVISIFIWDLYVWNSTTAIATVSSVGGYIGFLLFVFSLQRGKVGVSASIANTYPVIAVLFGVFVLNEPLSLPDILGIVVTIVGVFGLSTKFSLTGFITSDKRSVLLALGAMLGWSVQIIVADHVVNTLTPFQVTHMGATITMLLGVTLFFITKQSFAGLVQNRRSDLTICAVLGVLYFLGMLAIYTAFQDGKFSTFSAISGAGPFVAALFAHLFLGEALTGKEWLGILLVVVGLVTLGVFG